MQKANECTAIDRLSQGKKHAEESILMCHKKLMQQSIVNLSWIWAAFFERETFHISRLS